MYHFQKRAVYSQTSCQWLEIEFMDANFSLQLQAVSGTEMSAGIQKKA